MAIKKSTINFNKEMIFAELGSFLCTPAFAYLFSAVTHTPKIISFGAVLGGIVGSSISYVVTRLWDKNYSENKNYKSKELIDDLKYFTPVAFLLALVVYYPVVFFVSKHLIVEKYKVTISASLAQMGAFILIAILLNIYRVILRKITGKEL